MAYDLTVIGHVSRDIMIYQGDEHRLLGGAVLYASIAAARVGARVRVVTKCHEDDRPALSVMTEEGVTVTPVRSETTTSIENRYHSADKERRTARLIAHADPLSESDVEGIESTVFQIAGLVVGEVPDRLITHLAARGLVGVDAQGLLRADIDGELRFRQWRDAARYMPSITYFKVDAAEAEALTGERDRVRAAERLQGMGAREVMVTHNSEVLVLTDGGLVRAPYNPRNLTGRTGRGDTTFAAYLWRRQNSTPYEAAFFAAALCSIKMERPGPFRGTVDEVHARMEEIGYRRA